LEGACHVIGGEPYRITFVANGWKPGKSEAIDAASRLEVVDLGRGLMAFTIECAENSLVKWHIRFRP